MAQSATAADWKAVDQALGRSGQVQGDGAYKFGLPRGDLHVTVDGIEVKPTLALGSWLAFSSPGADAMVMGDLVLTEDEVSPVMLALQENGLRVTALHNHVLHETPRVMYMHIAGHGDAVKLAGALKQVIALTKTPAPTPPAAAAPPALDLDTAPTDAALGAKGKANGGVYQVGVPRAEKITESGMAGPRPLGPGTAMNFQPTRRGKAPLTREFVPLGSPGKPGIKPPPQKGIQVSALYTPLTGEQPPPVF